MMNTGECIKAKVCICSLGVALGMAKGLFLMLLAWAGWMWGFGMPMIEHIGSFYHGYAPTLMGGFIGGGWGVLGGFILGIVIGFVYNFCLCACKKFCGVCKKK
ncbi:MAG: hypothetical protein K0S27_1558 [Gammaproteobacteria bacterium]|jgi:hypothetical protein|nr:hypothetical protein [Gammaproteobacteria bacterium]